MKREDIIKPENKVYSRPRLLDKNVMHYCPGCSHGVVHKLVAEVIEELGLEEDAIGIAPVGCSVFAYNYIDCDWIEAAHGRAPALATADSTRAVWYLRIRATATSPPSDRPRQYMPARVVKTSL